MFPNEVAKDSTAKLESKVVDQTKFKDVKADSEYKTTQLKTESYKVQSGDTLSSIAMQSKMTLSELADLNNLSTSKGLMAGQTLKIPAGSVTPDSYTVQSGDSLIAVAAKYNLSVSQVADWNNINTNAGLFVGQKLKLNDDGHSKTVVKQEKVAQDKTTQDSTKQDKAKQEKRAIFMW